ncbi:MAG: PAS domain S-box protein [bacterium]
MDIFKLLTPVTYWILIVVWAYILSFYLVRLRSGRIKTGLTVTLLIILSIEAFRTLFESIYFGAWYTSLQGMLPSGVHDFLIRPDMVIIPKLLNVFAAFVIIVILIRRWIPQEQAYGKETDRIIEKQTQELVEKNRQLNLEMVRRETIEKQLKEHRDHLESIVEKRTEQLERSNEQLKKEIEERNLIKNNLDKTYTELDQIFNNAAIGIRVIGQDHHVIRVNDRLLGMTGLERSEIMSKHCHELFTGPDCQTDRCTLRMIEANTGPYELEVERVGKDGRAVPYLLTATPYFDTGGTRIGVIESFLDISNRKKIEKAFKDERDLFMAGVVVVFRWRNTENWPVDYVSPNVQKILGYRPEEFLNEQIHYKDLIDERDLDRVYRRKMAPSEAEIDSLEHAPYRLRHKNGNLVWILDYTRFVRNQAGEVEFLHGYIIDISRYKATEEKLENQAQLAHTGRLTALGEMASGMAHELNQPMTVIRLAADGLKMFFAQNPSGSTESESVDDIITQVKRATKSSKTCALFHTPSRNLCRKSTFGSPLKMRFPFSRSSSESTRSTLI